MKPIERTFLGLAAGFTLFACGCAAPEQAKVQAPKLPDISSLPGLKAGAIAMRPGRGAPAIVIPAGSPAAQETAMMRGTAGMPPGKVAAGRLPELQLTQGSAPEKRSVLEISAPPEIPAKPVLVAPALLD